MTIVAVTIKGLLRDRVLQGILVAGLVFLVIPSISTLSMRQVTELSLTLCLSLVSFILLAVGDFSWRSFPVARCGAALYP